MHSTRIRQARRHAGLSQQGLAERVGVTRGAVANWESSGKALPSSRHLRQVAIATHVHHEWLATGRGPMTSTPDAVQPGEWVSEPDELRLLVVYRQASPRARAAILEVAELGRAKRADDSARA